MEKQWSLESVCLSHNYDIITKTDVHNNFAIWLDRIYKDKKIKIVDIGGGNGRVCLNIDKNIQEYWCLDLNSSSLKAGEKFFENDKRLNFLLFDVDTQKLEIECDVIYIDSVLTMLENPLDSIINFSKVSDFIFINRTPFSEPVYSIISSEFIKVKPKKSKFRWGGMIDDSALWTFDYNYMKEFCLINSLELIYLNNSTFVIGKSKI